LKFDDLSSAIDLECDLELMLVTDRWDIVKTLNSDLNTWLSEDYFRQLFSDISEYKVSETVFVFESFERVYKSSGIKKRLSTQLNLNWNNFDGFQCTTEILEFYMVPKNLSWVLYANRDFCQFANSY